MPQQVEREIQPQVPEKPKTGYEVFAIWGKTQGQQEEEGRSEGTRMGNESSTPTQTAQARPAIQVTRPKGRKAEGIPVQNASTQKGGRKAAWQERPLRKGKKGKKPAKQTWEQVPQGKKGTHGRRRRSECKGKNILPNDAPIHGN